MKIKIKKKIFHQFSIVKRNSRTTIITCYSHMELIILFSFKFKQMPLYYHFYVWKEEKKKDYLRCVPNISSFSKMLLLLLLIFYTTFGLLSIFKHLHDGTHSCKKKEKLQTTDNKGNWRMWGWLANMICWQYQIRKKKFFFILENQQWMQLNNKIVFFFFVFFLVREREGEKVLFFCLE